jgi:hypothetical protein
MAVVLLNSFNSESKLQVTFEELRKYASGGSGSNIKHDGEPVVIQMDAGDGGAYFPPFALTDPVNTGDKQKLCINIKDEQIIGDFKALDNHLLQEFIGQRHRIFPKPPAEDYIRANYNSIIKKGGEQKDGGSWPDMIRLKYKAKADEKGVIVDTEGEDVDPSTLYGRKCKKLLFHLSIMYSAGKAYGVTMNLIKMMVSDNTLSRVYDFVDATLPTTNSAETPVSPVFVDTTHSTSKKRRARPLDSIDQVPTQKPRLHGP